MKKDTPKDKAENNFTIKQWAVDDRPREKLLLKGRSSLSDAELLAILIRIGNKKENAVELAKKMLAKVGGNLIELSKLTVNDMSKFSGIGKTKGATIVAALELGRRRREAEALEKKKIVASKDVFDIFQSVVADCSHEEFWMLCLNRSSRVICKLCISEGGVAGTVADPRKIFRQAIENNATSIIICHNHPSGNVHPSDSDIKLTTKLKMGGELLDVSVLDHIIIGDEKYYSFADEAKL